MTDARFPERYLMDRRLVRLDPVDFRSFTMAMLWSVSNRTDGLVEPEDRILIPGFAESSTAALVACGLWTVADGGWLIADFASTQTSRHDLDVLENARRRDREKKARQRAAESYASVTGTVPGDTSPGTAQARTGQDFKGIVPKKFCEKHPSGTEDRCYPCGEARKAFDIWSAREKALSALPPRRELDPSECEHKILAGACVHCGYLEGRVSAA